MGDGTQYTVNNQMVNATLMNIADSPTNVQLPGVYKNEEVSPLRNEEQKDLSHQWIYLLLKSMMHTVCFNQQETHQGFQPTGDSFLEHKA